MAHNSFTEELTAGYVEQYLENSKKISYDEIINSKDVETVLYKDLPNTEVRGFPYANDYVDKDGGVYTVDTFERLTKEEQSKLELRYHFLPKYHELYVGTTGSGKTTGCMEPELRAVAMQKNKPNLFITDPKGEIFEHNARFLKERGYRLYILNFKDFSRSDRWNPLSEMYEKKMSVNDIGKDVKVRTGALSDDLLPYNKPEDFSEFGYIECEGRAFATGEAFDRYINFRKDVVNSEVASLVNEFANQAIQVQSQNDRTWEQGAQNFLKGLLLSMLEDAATPGSGFTEDMMTIKTIEDYYTRLRRDFVDNDDRPTLERHPIFRGKSPYIVGLTRTVLVNAPNTRRSYAGVYEGYMNKWNLGHVYALTTGSTIDIEADDDRPFAIFIATRDYDKSDYTIAGLFVDWVYRKMLLKAENSAKNADNVPTTRAMHFMLDEFCNIPPIKDFENKIATARSRNIWFHLFVQSYEQLDLTYSENTAKVIRDNCNVQVFLGSQSVHTKQQFSAECGKTWVPSFSAQFDPQDKSLSEVSVVPVSDLDLISEGQIYMKRLYTPVIVSEFFRSYVCAEQGAFTHFRDERAYRDLTPVNDVSFTDDAHTYGKVIDNIL